MRIPEVCSVSLGHTYCYAQEIHAFFALQFEVQSNLLKALCGSPWGRRGGEGREGEGRGGDKGSVAESERERGVLYEYVPVNGGASAYSSHYWDGITCLQ